MAALLLIQLPTDVPGKAVKDSKRYLGDRTHVRMKFRAPEFSLEQSIRYGQLGSKAPMEHTISLPPLHVQ